MLIILLWLKKLRPILKLLSLKLMTESELLSMKIFLVKTLKIGQEKYFLLIPFWKLKTWTYKIKNLKVKGSKGEKVIGSFYEKELSLSTL